MPRHRFYFTVLMVAGFMCLAPASIAGAQVTGGAGIVPFPNVLSELQVKPNGSFVSKQQFWDDHSWVTCFDCGKIVASRRGTSTSFSLRLVPKEQLVAGSITYLQVDRRGRFVPRGNEKAKDWRGGQVNQFTRDRKWRVAYISAQIYDPRSAPSVIKRCAILPIACVHG